MNCDICKKEVGITNIHTVIHEGRHLRVCGKHYTQRRKYGKFIDSSPRALHDSNEFETSSDYARIFTKRRDGSVSSSFIVDIEDLDRVITKKWRHWHGRYYTGVKKPVTISDFILQCDKGSNVIDHINHNPSDNRRSNLRVIPQQKNTCNKVVMSTNTSGVSGVWYDVNRKKWAVEIKHDYLKCHIGRFNSKEDACYARWIAEEIVFGEYRNTSNDDLLLELANGSMNKKQIEERVTKRIQDKYSIAN